MPPAMPGRSARPLFRDFTAGPWKAACFDHGKPSTQKGLRSAAENPSCCRRSAPARLDRITRSMVLRWFEGYSRTAPGGANKALDLLRGILYHAIVCGHIETNPTRGIKRNPGREAHPVPVSRGNRPPAPGSGPICRGFPVRKRSRPTSSACCC